MNFNTPSLTMAISWLGDRQWNLDELGRRRFFQGRNREERDIVHDDNQPSLEVRASPFLPTKSTLCLSL